MTRRVVPMVVCSVALGMVLGCSGDWQRRPTGSEITEGTPSAVTVRLQYRLAVEGLPAGGRWKSTPVVADLNGDGIPDLAVHPRLEKGTRAWLGAGNGRWTDSSRGFLTEGTCGGAIQAGDVNNDGNLDLVIADHCDGVYVYLGDGKGGWQLATAKLQPEIVRKNTDPEGNKFAGTEVVAVGDINGDGFLDIVAAASDDGGFAVYLGDGTGKNWKEVDAGLPNPNRREPASGQEGGWAMDVQLVDINGDGNLDVVASYYSGPRVWLGDGKGRFEDRSNGLMKTSLAGIYRRLAIGDIDGDGRLDLAVSNSINGAEAYLQRADGSWQGPIDMMPELKGGAEAVALGDLNGDGKLDVVIGGSLAPSAEANPFGLFIRLGDGKGGWMDGRSNLPRKGLEPIWGIRLADVNLDGRLDIVVTTGGASGLDSRMGALLPGRRSPQGAPRGASGGAGQEAPKEKPPNIQVWLLD